MNRKKMGYIEDRLVTPYVIWEYLPAQNKFVEFPFVYDNEYQKTRYYSDERPMKYEDFFLMCKGHFCKKTKN